MPLKQVVRLAVYSKTEYNYLLEVLDDATDIPACFEQWLELHKAEKQAIYNRSCKIKEIKIDVDELIEYCELRKLKIDAKAIIQFVKNY